MFYNDWKDQMVSTHFAFRSTAFIKDQSEVRYINECATKQTIEACETLDWEVPKLGQWCVVSAGTGDDREGQGIAELGRSDGNDRCGGLRGNLIGQNAASCLVATMQSRAGSIKPSRTMRGLR